MSLLSFQCRHDYPGGFVLDVGFELNHAVTSLFGPSGSGKTSVLSIIAGLLRPREAAVRLGEHTVLDTAKGVFVLPERRQVGMVFQDQLLFPHLSVEANLRYGARHRRGHKRQVRLSRVAEVLEIGDLLRRLPNNLSGGERQRVALGRALLSLSLIHISEPTRLC